MATALCSMGVAAAGRWVRSACGGGSPGRRPEIHLVEGTGGRFLARSKDRCSDESCEPRRELPPGTAS